MKLKCIAPGFIAAIGSYVKDGQETRCIFNVANIESIYECTDEYKGEISIKTSDHTFTFGVKATYDDAVSVICEAVK